MPGIQVPDFIPPGLTRGAPGPPEQPNTEPLAPTQPAGPAPYDGPDFISRLTEAGWSKEEVIAALIRRINLDRAPKRDMPYYNPNMGAQTDANGNLVQKLYDVAVGFKFRVHNVTVALTSLGTYDPSTPYGGAGIFMFMAIGSSGGGNDFESQITNLWPGMIAFAPVTTNGPVLPGQWTFGTHDAPLLHGGESLWLCLDGSAAIANQGLNIDIGGRLREHP